MALAGAQQAHEITRSAFMTERAPELEVQYLRERAAALRDMAQSARPPSIASQLLDVAVDLERRAVRLEQRP